MHVFGLWLEAAVPGENPQGEHAKSIQKDQPGMESFAPVIFIFPFTNLSIVTSLKGKQVL